MSGLELYSFSQLYVWVDSEGILLGGLSLTPLPTPPCF